MVGGAYCNGKVYRKMQKREFNAKLERAEKLPSGMLRSRDGKWVLGVENDTDNKESLRYVWCPSYGFLEKVGDKQVWVSSSEEDDDNSDLNFVHLSEDDIREALSDDDSVVLTWRCDQHLYDVSQFATKAGTFIFGIFDLYILPTFQEILDFHHNKKKKM